MLFTDFDVEIREKKLKYRKWLHLEVLKARNGRKYVT